ncbi:MAG: hypothetical protein ABR498_06405 [Candidatus Dormibacteria bacterium]
MTAAAAATITADGVFKDMHSRARALHQRLRRRSPEEDDDAPQP